MERRKALALAGAATLVLGTSVVAASALGGLGLLGFGASEASGIGAFTTSPTTASNSVTRTRDVYDTYVVGDGTDPAVTGTPSSGTTPAGSPSELPEVDGTPDLPPGAGTPTGNPASTPPTSRPDDDPAPTSVPSPPTTHHREHEGPPGSTVPPPPNCTNPQWDDGHWVCGDD
jgi:hypothetical protein